MSNVVLDASAVLALLANESGADQVESTLGSALLSAVNLAEVNAKLTEYGLNEDEQRRLRGGLDIEVRAFDEGQALTSGLLRTATRMLGLSLGDRACLALALREGLPALTADRTWSRLDVGVEIRVIR